jgi:hypothetical protein
MATLYRNRAIWSGISGTPGYSTFYSTGAANPAALRTFFAAIQNLIPSPCAIQVLGQGETIDDSNDQITGTWSTAAPTSVACAGAAYAAPCGALVTWISSTVRRRKILKGRTFIVPLVSTSYTTSGNIVAASVTTLQNAATALVTAYAGTMVVYGRQILNYSTKPPTLVAAGVSAPVTGALVQSRVVTLRTRRD